MESYFSDLRGDSEHHILLFRFTPPIVIVHRGTNFILLSEIYTVKTVYYILYVMFQVMVIRNCLEHDATQIHQCFEEKEERF